MMMDDVEPQVDTFSMNYGLLETKMVYLNGAIEDAERCRSKLKTAEMVLEANTQGNFHPFHPIKDNII